MSNRLGIFLKEKRNEKKLTLKELGETIGYSDAYLSMVETGKKKQPSYEFLEAIAKGLNQEQHYLMYLAGYNNNEIETNTKKDDEEMQQLVLAILEERRNEIIKDFPQLDNTPNITIDNKGDTIFELSDSLNSNTRFSYKNKLLTETDKKNIIKFIETFIVNEEGE